MTRWRGSAPPAAFWWTAADDAELDLLVHEFVLAAFRHGDCCETCQPPWSARGRARRRGRCSSWRSRSSAGRPAFGEYEVPVPGTVVLVMEESGRAAFHRRLDRLARGYALDPQALDDLHFAANLGVRLNDPAWQNRLLDAALELRPRVVMLDPFVRLKGAEVDESSQREIGPVLDFLRTLRDDGQTGVLYAHHTGHQGTHQRGSSDLEGYWESRLAIEKGEDGTRTVKAEHREAESGHSFRFLLDFDETTRSLRLKVKRGDLEEAVEDYLRANPTASKNETATNVDGRRSDVLRLYDVVKARLFEPRLDDVA